MDFGQYRRIHMNYRGDKTVRLLVPTRERGNEIQRFARFRL